MRSFNKSNRSGGGSSFNKGGRGFERGRNRSGGRQFFKTICSSCGKECEVPFKPTSGKPVYCRDCYKENGGDVRRSEEVSFQRPNFNKDTNENSNADSFQYKEQFASLNMKLDKILSILTAAISSEVTPVDKEEAPEKKKRLSKKSI